MTTTQPTQPRIIIDNGGGITLQLPGYAACRWGQEHAVAEDIRGWYADGHTSGWDLPSDQEEYEAARDLEPTPDEIRNGGYRVVYIYRERSLAELAVEIAATGGAAATALALELGYVEQPCYVADDGNAQVLYDDVDTSAEAAQEYAGAYEVEEGASSYWVTVYVRRVLPRLGEDHHADCDHGPHVWCVPPEHPLSGACLGEYETHLITIDPDEPACYDDDGQEREHGHDWQSPYEIVGGIEDNPGVWGHGGGVIIREACMRCGTARVTDTWAQDPETGQQGLTSVHYERGRYAAEIMDPQ